MRPQYAANSTVGILNGGSKVRMAQRDASAPTATIGTPGQRIDVQHQPALQEHS